MNIILKESAITSNNNNNNELNKSSSSNSLKQLVNSNNNNEPETYCICKKAFDSDDDDMMIECDVCKNWFHGRLVIKWGISPFLNPWLRFFLNALHFRCVDMNQRLAADIEIYVCPCCLTEEKQIICKYKNN